MPTNKEIISLFISEKRTSNTKNLWSDGMFLYSYSLCIASIMFKKIIITDYTAPFNVSQTTSKHVSLLKRECANQNIEHAIIEPYYQKFESKEEAVSGHRWYFREVLKGTFNGPMP
tara:strand:- start:1356 stop:1703 length:348 start_codon:yes stop_codon:yes gene_type:complete